MRPTAVVVTGAPGSGKTTMGTALARALRVPFLARDDVRGGLYLTAGAWTDQPGPVPSAVAADESFFAAAASLLGAGISCVVERAVRRTDDITRITGVARVVVVRTTCDAALDRFARRNREDGLLTRPAVLASLGYASIDDQTEAAVERMRRVGAELRDEFDVPLLEVDTTDGWVPDLDAVVAFVTGA